ncbi:transglycosylase family protein [Streptomyces sp. NPDC052040]|uniref:transglycosylase family protein n=1 Tax=Streptomyces sp. NPDC052040 TaxID=3365682 RepID=UPI0037CE2D39
MLSGNGRHRRPRQAPALLVAAGVTGSAIAIPLLGATGASAASGTTWDRVAECESGGSWSADHGNGRYGGLQLTQEDWDTYGGLDYAPSPDQASRSQQIAVAEKVLDHKGVSAWSTCALVSGLSQDSSATGVDTGMADADSGDGSVSFSGSGMDMGVPKSSNSSQSSQSSPSPSGSPSAPHAPESSASGTASSTPSSTPSSSSSAPSSSPSGTTTGPAANGTGGATDPSGSKSPGTTPSTATKSDESDKVGQNVASSGDDADGSAGAGRHRGGTGDEGAEGDPAGRHASRGTTEGRETADGSYTVRPGDNLSAIADSLDLKGGWAALYDANKETVGTDPNLILPGQSLAVAGGPSADAS